MYGEFMRRGFSGAPFHEFVGTCLQWPKTLTPYLHVRQMLTMWIKVFGRDALSVRLFDRARLQGGDILTDLMGQVFGDALPDLSEMVRSPDDNTGLSAPALEFLRRLHPYIPNRKDGAVNPARARLARRIASLPATPRPRMSSAQSNRIMTHFQPANDWLQETFFPDFEGPIFPHRPAAEEPGNLHRITVDEFTAFTGHLLS
jgi:hypothetical protein